MSINRNLKVVALPLIIACTGIYASGVLACEDGNSRQEKRLQHLTESLQLSDTQVAEFKAIMSVHHEAMRESREEIRQSREALKEQLKSVLSEEQIEDFESMPRPGKRVRQL